MILICARTALFSLQIKAIGLFFIAFCASAALAFAGTAITGLGYSLVYPGFGVEAIRRALDAVLMVRPLLAKFAHAI